MIKVAQYIDTMGTEPFKMFLRSPFDFKNITKYFEGWERNDRTQYVSSNGDVVEITDSGDYVVNKTTLPHSPRTINDFINDMCRMDVNLYWGVWIEECFQPKDYLPQDEIEKYYIDLLSDMDKGHELLTKTSQKNENDQKI